MPRALGQVKRAEAWIDWDAAYGPRMEPRVAPPHGIPQVDDGYDEIATPKPGGGERRLRAVPDVVDPEPVSALPGAIPGRRTVTIRGQVSERSAPRRPARTINERAGSRPDRVAMWAVLLGVLLILVAATSSHAAMRHRVVHRAAAAPTLVARHVTAARDAIPAHQAVRGRGHHAAGGRRAPVR